MADDYVAGSEAGSLRLRPVQEIARADGGVVVRLAGELDLYNAHLVREALLESLRGNPKRLIVDLERVSFIDSTALGVLIEARAGMESRNTFLLAAPGLEARRALEVSGLNRHFSVHDTVEDALGTTL